MHTYMHAFMHTYAHTCIFIPEGIANILYFSYTCISLEAMTCSVRLLMHARAVYARSLAIYGAAAAHGCVYVYVYVYVYVCMHQMHARAVFARSLAIYGAAAAHGCVYVCICVCVCVYASDARPSRLCTWPCHI